MTFHMKLVLGVAVMLAFLMSFTSAEPPPGRPHFRAPPYLPNLKIHSKRFRPPLRIHHVHLNYPSPVHYSRAPSTTPYVPTGPPPPPPPRKYAKPTLPSKAHFNPSPPAHFLTPIIDANEGAIHTIPAPNLGPSGDRPHPPPALVTSIAGAIPTYENLVKVQPTISQFNKGYEVHELDSAKGGVGKPFYAPDPDPSLPAPLVPVTRDPHSHPSNGKVPLDLILQQQLEKQQQRQNLGLSRVYNTGYSAHQDPNSQFLQAFQDQYKYHQPYEGEYLHAQGSEHQPSSIAAPADTDLGGGRGGAQVDSDESPELDYDSGAEVRYSFSSGPQGGSAFVDQDDAASEVAADQELLQDSGTNFGQRIKPKKNH